MAGGGRGAVAGCRRAARQAAPGKAPRPRARALALAGRRARPRRDSATCARGAIAVAGTALVESAPPGPWPGLFFAHRASIRRRGAVPDVPDAPRAPLRL